MNNESDEVIGDIISRLIGGDMGSGEQWRPAATLDFLTQGLVKVAMGDGENASFARDILGDILLSMTYLELAESDEEQEAYDRQWAGIVSRIMRPEDDEDEDDDDEDE